MTSELLGWRTPSPKGHRDYRVARAVYVCTDWPTIEIRLDHPLVEIPSLCHLGVDYRDRFKMKNRTLMNKRVRYPKVHGLLKPGVPDLSRKCPICC
jgi:hypothetical protein